MKITNIIMEFRETSKDYYPIIVGIYDRNIIRNKGFIDLL